MTSTASIPALSWCIRRAALVAATGFCLAGVTLAHAAEGEDVPLSPAPAASAAPDSPDSEPTSGSIEVGVAGAHLSDGLQHWTDGYALGSFRPAAGTVLYWSLASQRHFGETGTVGALSMVHDFTPDWYGMVGVSGASASFQNRYRLDAGAYRKWGEERRWVTGIALMHSASGDHIHHDNALRATLLYYAPADWIGEAGLSVNRSSPGAVTSTRGFVAATLGQVGKRTVGLRLEHGQEGYLPVAAGMDLPLNVRFRSSEATLQWRQWVTRRWGYVVGAQLYRNPYYHRAGLQFGIFMDF
ncbi:YaiO family outer membrane beta-barrel protein [Pulveribacter sp.]|uniref:YaiO family outer membrane beta-barrel protein n=1 Tax=Pulveribacter sp. TaxID=2678893 RepID=UPI0028982F3C|nr:YaiO family outer membrane beta-barrel protein [Pulveribacter sp.]